MAPPLQFVKRNRPWSDEDLPMPLIIKHPAAFKAAIKIHRSETGDLNYYKEAITTNLYNCNTCPNIIECLDLITGSRQEGEITV